jgi:hypothetical protein
MQWSLRQLTEDAECIVEAPLEWGYTVEQYKPDTTAAPQIPI